MEICEVVECLGDAKYIDPQRDRLCEDCAEFLIENGSLKISDLILIGEKNMPTKTKKPTVLKEFKLQKSPTALIVGRVNEFKGKKNFQIMEMWKPQNEPQEEWRFSKKCITLDANGVNDFLTYIKDFGKLIQSELK